MSAEIKHVSDTALYVGGLRAIESARPDALMRDPLAERLAGERGIALTRTLSGGSMTTIALAVRFRVIDEFVLRAIREGGVRTVLNVGAGLDTRPWRLDVPEDLVWVEADFPEMLEFKAERLAGVEPRCRLVRVAADIADAEQRRRMWDSLGGEPAVMITEGLLLYLSATTVNALATEAKENAAVKWWTFDVVSQELRRRAHGNSWDQLEAVREAEHLDGDETVDAVRARGWRENDFRGMGAEAWRLGRERMEEAVKALAARNPASIEPPPAHDVSGIWLFAPERQKRLTAERRSRS